MHLYVLKCSTPEAHALAWEILTSTLAGERGLEIKGLEKRRPKVDEAPTKKRRKRRTKEELAAAKETAPAPSNRKLDRKPAAKKKATTKKKGSAKRGAEKFPPVGNETSRGLTRNVSET